MTDENQEVTTQTSTATAETSAGAENTSTTGGTAGEKAESQTALSGATSGEAGTNEAKAQADEGKATQTTEEWREKIAKHDEKSADRLNRFSSLEALWDSYRNLEQKLSSGALKKELPTDATPEQISAWRKDNGVPETAADYDLKFEDGLVIGDADKPAVDKFLEKMHAKNASNAVTKEAIAAYFAIRNDQAKALNSFQEETTNSTIQDLKKEWGADKFDRNIQIIKDSYIANDDLFNKINSAVLPDGKSLASDKDMIRFLAAKAFQENPYATVSNGSGMATGHSIKAEIEEIEGLMGDRNSKYWKGSEATAMQARYLELTRANQAIKK